MLCGLGRLPATDERDRGYMMQAVLPKRIPTSLTYKYWYANGLWADQGEKPHCVGYSWLHFLEDSPFTHPATGPVIDPSHIYHQAQLVDEWEGVDYDGTSVRAGAKVLKELGYISGYYWAFDVDTVVDALLTRGPVIVGTNWYSDMFSPNADGLITATGYNVGGHAYKLDGVNINTKLFRIKNSWGRGWGKSGHAYISFADMGKLISEYGEAAIATEIKKT